MGEVDYQLALLLQHQFEQELKGSKECNSDLELAKHLQEQFQLEFDEEKPKNHLVYNQKVNKNRSKCLTDPSWEVVDPTPDIHVLFMAFNERFFWNKLLAVCVSWSKRMTSCAGICSYQGKGGLCSITLSEPLLKLRPRKDLVETLLHEMIHAFLFVTDNNRDRDGHGPEFHKHMYRINGESGTNITVYHDFHDEVRLYQHWWRCDGPCQKWKPYFGMVRRAINRPPGPQDQWWGKHSRNCGGNFIKVKEPENKPQKKSSKSSTKENTNPKEDIRKFLPSINNVTANVPASSKVLSNVHTITNKNSASEISAVIPSKVSNIFGFTNLNGSKNPTNGGRPSSSKVRGAFRNNSNTIVINKTQNIPKTNTDRQSKQNSVTSSPGMTLTTPLSNNSFDYSTVRNHWLNKYSDDGPSTTVKRKLPEDSSNHQNKILKTSPNVTSTKNTIENVVTDEMECPICMKKVLFTLLDAHIDECLQRPNKDCEKECILCGKKIHLSEFENHLARCTEEDFNDNVFENPQESECIKCSFCRKNVCTKSYDNHLTTCLRDFVDNMDQPKDNVIDLTGDNLEEKQCAACDMMIAVSSYDSHVEKCLLKMYDNMENDYGHEKNGEVLIGKEENVDCLACGNEILKSELSLHLEDCMSLSRVFDDDNEPKEESEDCKEQENKFNCPFCMQLVSELEMNDHIDICLTIKDSSIVIEKDKSILMESLSSSDDFEL